MKYIECIVPEGMDFLLDQAISFIANEIGMACKVVDCLPTDPNAPRVADPKVGGSPSPRGCRTRRWGWQKRPSAPPRNEPKVVSVNGLRVEAYGAYIVKELLKQRGYKYDGENHTWFIVTENEVAKVRELDFLTAMGFAVK